MMEIIYRNPCQHKVEEVLIGNTTFLVDGWYNDGLGETPLSGGGATAPVKPDFEIASISMLLPTDRGNVSIDITKLIDDLNTISWRKDTGNDLFEHFSEELIKRFSSEV